MINNDFDLMVNYLLLTYKVSSQEEMYFVCWLPALIVRVDTTWTFQSVMTTWQRVFSHLSTLQFKLKLNRGKIDMNILCDKDLTENEEKRNYKVLDSRRRPKGLKY